MSAYYFTFLAVIVFCAFAVRSHISTANTNVIVKKSQPEKVWLVCVILVLVFVAGLRFFVGTDYSAYYSALQTYPHMLITSIKEMDEPGFPILATILKWFTDDGAVFIFVTAAFTNGAILFMTYKYTDTYMFSTLLFIFIGVWDGSFNGIRQYVAATIICLGHRFILDKKMWKYMLCVFIAFLFHSSAIVMVLPYFILRNKVSFKNILILTIGSIILLYNYEFIFSTISNFKDETMELVEGTYRFNKVNPIRILVNSVPAIFCTFLYITSPKDKEKTFYLNILILYALLSIIGMNSPYLTRVNIYLQVCLPIAMGKLITFSDKKIELFIKWVIIVSYFAFWLYDVSKSPDLNNFRWIWER